MSRLRGDGYDLEYSQGDPVEMGNEERDPAEVRALRKGQKARERCQIKKAEKREKGLAFLEAQAIMIRERYDRTDGD